MDDLIKLASLNTFEVKGAGEDEDGIYIEGYASVPIVDRDNEIVEINAMNISNFNKNPILLYQHKRDEPIGKIIELEKRSEGLWIKAWVLSHAIWDI